MNSQERILCALNNGIPDVVPYMYNNIAQDLQERLMQKKLDVYKDNPLDPRGIIAKPGEPTWIDIPLSVAPEVADFLHLDAIGVQVMPPLFANVTFINGIAHLRDGLLTSRDALQKAIMPDPDDEKIYKRINEMIQRYKDDYAFYVRTRLGASATLNSMGIEAFSYSLYDEPELVNDVLTMFCDWSAKVNKNLSELDIDFIWCFDDIAFKTSPMFSKKVFRDLFMPNLKKATTGIKKPWVFHSDGNLIPILDDLLELGMDAIHPLEPGTMDLDFLKKEYGKKICLAGNIDIDAVLSRGTTEDVFREVKERIDQLAPGGGYIISDSNSVPSYCKPENIIAMSQAVEKYRYVY